MDEFIGQVINNFELQEIVGRGGMGVVYRAWHAELERYAAVKIMRPEWVDQPDSYERFLQEARTASHLDHANVVKVLNFGRIANSYYIMMDFIEGVSLRQLIVENPNGMPLEEVINIFIQIADVLAYAHQEGLLHRDLKPDNILITENSAEAAYPIRAMVTDFGLVKMGNGALAHTQEGLSLGTPAYMSPEQCKGQEVDKRTDIYALGVMLYEALTGKRPYPIRNLFDAIKFHGTGNFTPPRAHVPTLPMKLNLLVRQMMAPDLDGRPATMLEVAEKLRPFLPQITPSIHTSQLAERLASEIQPPTAPLVETEEKTPSAPPEQLCVLVTYKGQIEKIYPLPLNGRELIVGRQQGSDIILDGPERYVSKQHCAIALRGETVYIRDLNSTNGTFLDTTRLVPQVERVWERQSDVNLGAFKLSIQLQRQSDKDMPLPVDAGDTIIQGRYTLACVDGLPARVALHEAPVIIGRIPGCDMVLNNTRVSKRHCRIERMGNSILVTDLGSTNGTYLGDQRLPANTPIEWHGDIPLRVGISNLLLER
ncbi:MAG: protein kinase [Chloroflexi bacterium]|nr:protein kinase [Chloroflexota bacterium]